MERSNPGQTWPRLSRAKVSAANHKEITKLKGASRMVSSNWESPIDYNKSQIKQVPIAADTITFDAQYFSVDMNQEGSSSHTSVRPPVTLYHRQRSFSS